MWGEASFEGLTPGGLGSASSRDDETGTFGSHSLSGDFSSPESYPNKGERSKQEAATGLPPDPSTLWLWAETSDKARQAHAGKGAAATSLKFLHGTFVRSLTLFADAWVSGEDDGFPVRREVAALLSSPSGLAKRVCWLALCTCR